MSELAESIARFAALWEPMRRALEDAARAIAVFANLRAVRRLARAATPTPWHYKQARVRLRRQAREFHLPDPSIDDIEREARRLRWHR